MKVVIKRSGGMGDIIHSFIIAEKLTKIGCVVDIVAKDYYLDLCSLSPYINKAYDRNNYEGIIDIELDGVYELTPTKNIYKRKHNEIKTWVNRVNNFLVPFNKKIDSEYITPELKLQPKSKQMGLDFLKQYQKPWNIFVRGSHGDKTRRIQKNTYEQLSKYMNGTCFMLDWDNVSGTIKLPIFNITELCSFIYNCDYIITPLSGALHVAESFKKNIITINQSNIIDLVFPNNNMKFITNKLKCIGCLEWNNCKKEEIEEKIPCQQINYKEILKLI